MLKSSSDVLYVLNRKELCMDLLRFLYGTIPGRMLLKPLTAPGLSRLAGRLLDHPASRILIPGFVSRNHINLEEYQNTSYDSFNDFFCRKIKPQLRPVDPDPMHLISPCDGLLRVYPITEDLVLPVKQSGYSISSLLRSKALARRFEGGYCMVFRLCVDHYHRYCYPADARRGREVRIDGIYHTVRPVALESLPVFLENTREYCLLKTRSFGTIVQMEVGAMLVGRICNPPAPTHVRRGEEKGFFQYGGSTIILLLSKNQVEIPESLRVPYEIPVRMGQMIGTGTNAEPQEAACGETG